MPGFPSRAFPGSAAWNWPHLLRLCSCPCCPRQWGWAKLCSGQLGKKKPERAADWSCLSMGLQRQVFADLYFASYLYNLKVWKMNFSLAFAKASCLSWWVNFEALYYRLVHMQRMSIMLSSNSFSYLKCHLLEFPYLLPPVKCKLNYRHIIKSAY